MVEKTGEEIMKSYLSRLKENGVNLDETQYILIRHNDKDHPHFHLVLRWSRTMEKGWRLVTSVTR